MHNRIILKKWCGGLCNNIVQLCHAIYLAQKTHSYLEVLSHGGLLKTHDLDFTDGEQIQNTISNNFFWLDRKILGVKTLDWNLRREILKRYIRPMLPEKIFSNTSEDGLTIHIRSGDIFKRKTAVEVFKEARNPLGGLKRVLAGTHRVNPLFVQPPLAFYQKVIESQPWSHALIVAQDTENPVIHALLRSYSNIEFQQRNLESDITALLSAQNLIIGYGTFGMTWALLSARLQSLYCPLLPAKVFGELYPEDLRNLGVHTFEFKNYIPLGQWKANVRQKRMMLNYKASNIIAIAPRWMSLN